MKIAVRYFTRGGNTKKLAEAIGDAVGAEALDVSKKLSEKADILFLGSSVYAWNADESVLKFISENRENIGVIVNFGSSAMGDTAFKKVKKAADGAGVKMSDKAFYSKGSFLFMNPGRPNGEDLKRAKEFAKKILEEM